MRYIWLLLVIPATLVVVLSSCVSNQVSPITQSPDKYTFVFFYTDP